MVTPRYRTYCAVVVLLLLLCTGFCYANPSNSDRATGGGKKEARAPASANNVRNGYQPPADGNTPPAPSDGKENPSPNAATVKQKHHPTQTGLTTDPLRDLLVVSTLDGTLTAVDRISGEVRWVSKDDKPMIQVPPTTGHHYAPPPPPPAFDQPHQDDQNHHQNSQKLPRAPYFLPDPKTGSLYMMGKQNSLRKLPFTIPQLVTMAPCKNSEGLLYTGKKLDVWVHLNPHTGEKFELPFDADDGSGTDDLWTCPAASYSNKPDHCKDRSKSPEPFVKSILIGKTEYTLSMMEGGGGTTSRRRWNVTYNYYSAKDMSAQSLQDYELVHFTSPSEGHLMTYERSSGELLWMNTELSSPVIAMYSIDAHSTNLLSVPFNPIASDTLERLKSEKTSSNKALSPTTYVGECAFGLYAVPALADEHVLVIGEGSKLPPLIEGPLNDGSGGTGNQEQSSTLNTDYLLLGYYEVNEASPGTTPRIEGVGVLDLETDTTGTTTTTGSPGNNESIGSTDSGNVIFPPGGGTDQQNLHNHVVYPDGTKDNLDIRYPRQDNSQNSPPPDRSPNIVTFPPPPTKRKSEIKIVFTTAIISIGVTASIMGAIFVAYRRYKNNQLAVQHRLLSGGDSGTLSSENNRLSGSNSSRTSVFALDGSITDMSVGKITLFPGQVLGKGCEGTFVFKGKFEGRDVAVKRILPECFAFADREVDLLKESDQHPNVIRYFCTETDGQFRYIALELCVATLSDWIEGRYANEAVDAVTVLREATEGLAHLHSLRIVHRDVKPANVLLGVGVSGGGVRTLISDFGLCKKIQNGRMSYSRRSGGVPGTDGWIAREVLCFGGGIGGEEDDVFMGPKQPANRMTYSVDIFSMGCVFFYVLTGGSHPFGENPFRRQSNILTGEYDLQKVSSNPRGAHDLIRTMISTDPAERPPLTAVLTHPLFWSNDKALGFFLDVSDRVEKESEDTFPLLRRVEAGAAPIVKNDWRDHICPHVAMDLRKYRTYKGHSLRDLLRALRNKKNHYRELTTEAQESLGNIPDQFVNYWVERFPKLLPYTWSHFEVLKSETVFAKYYPSGPFDFYEVLLPEHERGWAEDFQGVGITGSAGGPNDNPDSPDHNTQTTPMGKEFWRSKSQARYQKWRGRGGGHHHNRSPRRTNNFPEEVDNGGGPNNIPPANNGSPATTTTTTIGPELSASTDNYWRSKSPNKKSD